MDLQYPAGAPPGQPLAARSSFCGLERLVEDAVTAASQTALEDHSFLAVGVEAGARRSINGAVPGAVAGAAADRSGGGTNDGAARSAAGGAFLDLHLLAVRLALCPVAGEYRLVDAVHVDDGIGMGRAAGNAGRDHYGGKEAKESVHEKPQVAPRTLFNDNGGFRLTGHRHSMAASSHENTARAILYAFLANFGIALSKTWAAWLTGSGSMLAEAIHSYADSGNQVLLYLGIRQSTREPDAKHPLGYGKLSYFWSFIVAMLLFSVGGLFSVYEGFHKLGAPEPLNQIWVALLVLGVAIVLEGFSTYGCLREIKALRGERPFRSWLRHTRNSALVVVLGEDIAALLGLVLAFVFLSLASVTGDPVYDAIGSMCIGVVLIVVSIFLSIRVRSLLVGQSADPEIQEAIQAVIAETDDVVEVFNTITIQFGPDTMLATKIRLREGLSMQSGVAAINALERRLKETIPALKWCFVEPDLTDR